MNTPHPKWTVEYEIPPMRGIYWATFTAESEQSLRESITREQPRWVIRAITPIKT